MAAESNTQCAPSFLFGQNALKRKTLAANTCKYGTYFFNHFNSPFSASIVAAGILKGKDINSPGFYLLFVCGVGAIKVRFRW